MDLPAASSATSLPPAVVRGAPPDQPLRPTDASLPATVLTGPALRRRHLTLTDALDGRAGLRVQQLSGFGSTALLQIRGSSAEQVNVYLEDLPLQTVDGAALDLAEIPLGQIETVEVYRGGTPVWLGAQAMGGALRIRLHKAAKRSIFAQLAGGSWGARSAEVSGQLPVGKKWSASAGVRWLQADGNYPYLHNNATAFDASDDQTVRRQNNAIARLAGTVGVYKQLRGDESLSLRWFGHGLEQGLPGMALYPTRSARLQTHRQLLLGQWQGRSRLGAERLAVQWSGQWADTTVDDRKGEFGLAWHATQRVLGATLQTLWESRGLAYRQVHANLLIRLRASGATLGSTDHLGAGAAAAPTMHRLQAGGSVAVPLQGKHLAVTAEAGADALQDGRQARDRAPFVWEDVQPDVAVPWTARLGAALQLTQGLTASGSLTRAVRAPSLVELFGNTATVAGSPRLQSEHALSVDAGLAFRTAPGAAMATALEVRGFWSQAQDLIQLVQQSPHRAQYQNISAARLMGLELGWQMRWPWQLQTQLDATWLSAIDAGSDPGRRGRQLPMRPGQRVAGRLERAFSAKGVGVIPWAALNWQGSYALDAANLAMVPARTLLAVGARLRLPGGVWLDVRMDNLLNTSHFDLIGYPLPGRSGWLALGWSGG